MKLSLQIKNLETTFLTQRGPVKAIQNVSYNLYQGKTLGIVGESGCGKSVSSFSIMRLLQPPGKITQGEVWFYPAEQLSPRNPQDNPTSTAKNLLSLSEKEMQSMRGRHLAMIFQEPMTALNPVLTIGQQIDEQILQHNKIKPTEAKERSIEMLNFVGIPSPGDRYKSYPHQLSGGMRQRAMIAMALSCNPDILIADEPTTALDVTIQAQILELFQTLQKKLQMSIQFITHDLGVISEIADEVMVMYAGHVCEKATTYMLFSQPRHPYTAALMASRPQPEHFKTHSRLPTIEGQVPALYDLPPGCPFFNRCQRALPECKNQKPLLSQEPHAVACWNPL